MTDNGKQHWSIARRVAQWISISVLGLLVAEAVVASWLVNSTLQKELDALVLEESAEFRLGLLSEQVSADSLENLGLRLDANHPGARISIWVWILESEEPWVVAGASPRIPLSAGPSLGGPRVKDQTGDVRWVMESHSGKVTIDGEEPSPHELRAVMLIDGDPRKSELGRIAAFVLLCSSLMGAVVIASGFVLSRRLAKLFRQVADESAVAYSEGLDAVSAPKGAPEEVRAVTEAFSASLLALRTNHSRNLLMTAGLAHELRAPIQNLITDAEVGLLRDRPEGEYRDRVGGQLVELRKLALVVDNLITLTVLRDREALYRGESFDLGAEARLRLVHEEQQAARRNVTVEIYEHGDCRCVGDREALVLMLRNLVGNAASWTEVGTAVEVTIDGRGEGLILTIDDVGPGVREEEAESIFEAFYQGATPKGDRAGYGLGLALARAAARSDGGDIHVEKSPGGGARFVVELPLREMLLTPTLVKE